MSSRFRSSIFGNGSTQKSSYSLATKWSLNTPSWNVCLHHDSVHKVFHPEEQAVVLFRCVVNVLTTFLLCAPEPLSSSTGHQNRYSLNTGGATHSSHQSNEVLELTSPLPMRITFIPQLTTVVISIPIIRQNCLLTTDVCEVVVQFLRLQLWNK